MSERYPEPVDGDYFSAYDTLRREMHTLGILCSFVHDEDAFLELLDEPYIPWDNERPFRSTWLQARQVLLAWHALPVAEREARLVLLLLALPEGELPGC